METISLTLLHSVTWTLTYETHHLWAHISATKCLWLKVRGSLSPFYIGKYFPGPINIFTFAPSPVRVKPTSGKTARGAHHAYSGSAVHCSRSARKERSDADRVGGPPCTVRHGVVGPARTTQTPKGLSRHQELPRCVDARYQTTEN